MFTKAAIALLALGATTSASPLGSLLSRQATPPADPPTLATWSVTNFQEGCSPGGCVATYTVEAADQYIAGSPGFVANCTTIYIQEGWTDCKLIAEDLPAGATVQAIWESGPEFESIYVKVAHLWTEGETRHNATAWTHIDSGTTSFQLPVLQLSATL